VSSEKQLDVGYFRIREPTDDPVVSSSDDDDGGDGFDEYDYDDYDDFDDDDDELSEEDHCDGGGDDDDGGGGCKGGSKAAAAGQTRNGKKERKKRKEKRTAQKEKEKEETRGRRRKEGGAEDGDEQREEGTDTQGGKDRKDVQEGGEKEEDPARQWRLREYREVQRLLSGMQTPPVAAYTQAFVQWGGLRDRIRKFMVPAQVCCISPSVQPFDRPTVRLSDRP
jgi:hypothetical protein